MKNVLKLAYAALFALATTGCNEITNTNTDVPKEQYTSMINCYAAVVVKEAGPVIDTTTKKYKRSECPECRGTGIMVHGDGHRSPCNCCVPDNGEFQDSESNVVIESKPIPCCVDCICGDNCNCRYPAECLIKKNRGWPVQVCDETSCRVYYPKDENGESYNPYDLLTPQQKANPQSNRYKNPIKVDVYGNEIVENVKKK